MRRIGGHAPRRALRGTRTAVECMLTHLNGLQILRLLHPRDLLSLARTTKDFRALLMSRSSASCWATSRKQIQGLPEIPENLSEPAYANLIFCNHCHVRGHNISYPLVPDIAYSWTSRDASRRVRMYQRTGISLHGIAPYAGTSCESQSMNPAVHVRPCTNLETM